VAKAQHVQAGKQRKADAKAVLAAVDGMLSANGLAAADVKGYIDPLLVTQARRCAGRRTVGCEAC
jgi:hypothetical protein